MTSRHVRHHVLSALALLVVTTATAATVYAQEQEQERAGARSPVSAAPRATAPPGGEVAVEPSVEPGPRPAAVDRQALLAHALASIDAPEGARVSVAVLDVVSGESTGYGDAAFDTASIVKVDILAALLLRAQDEGRRLTAAEQQYATAMIENSDNDSASALWQAIGQAEGLDAANERLGLVGTEGGDGMLWGLTRTTAADQLTLLTRVFGEDSPLSAASRACVQGLMERIADGQQWGVSAAADGSAWALKNGWLPRSTTGLWDVNSIGRVSADGNAYLVAVLSDGNATQAAGIELVEAAAKAAVGVFADAA
ncbi:MULTISPECIES: serine hydrolase [unclassified Streptomyces]|uniref:serine hydrolase n=1 Tax=unclassified Streptomyces TaxID=2593676 RepID=UPI001F03F612|nr:MULTISPECIES: serine hydrolase [unclassified Streptomyces]MCH0567512.1 serine hydrolase [Streptomyces sp. MUM 2J]MCH0572079.1 serine hydrolase [Streptomyces sp. MUM 136J]